MRFVRWFPLLAIVACSTTEPGLDQIESAPTFWAAELWFNNKLRPDLAPLTASQSSGEDPRLPFVPEFLSGGNPDPTAIVTDIGVGRSGEFNDIDLKNTRCLWLGPSDEIELRWETAARVVPLDEDVDLIPGEDEVGFCTGTDPYTRERLHSAEDGYWPSPDEPPFEPGPPTVMVRARGPVDTSPFFNPDDLCLMPEDRLYGAPAAVMPTSAACRPDPMGFMLGCNPDGCAYPAASDRHFELSNEDPASGTVFNLRTVEPVLKRVSGTRQLVRPLREDGRFPPEFSWSVGQLSDGRWTENFSSSLRITSVRLFGLLPSGQRVYILPTTAVVGATACRTVQMADDHSLRCDGADPSQWVLNPAYEHRDPHLRLNWQFAFASDPRGGGETDSCCAGTQALCCDGGECPPMCDDGDELHAYTKLQERLFVEFTLVDLQHMAPDLFASPSTIDFGPVEWGSSWRQQVSVKNTGGVSVEIDSVDITGATGVFSVALPSGVRLPYTLGAGDHIVLDVAASPAGSSGTPEGALVVSARAATGATLSTTTALRVAAAGPIVSILFPHMEDTGGTMRLCTDATVLPVTIDNYGDRDLNRGAYTLQGPSAARFSLAPGSGSTLGAAVRPPGHGDALRVTFTPDPAGPVEQTAVLVATSDALNLPSGEIRIPITGYRDTSANHPGCDPWYSRRSPGRTSGPERR